MNMHFEPRPAGSIWLQGVARAETTGEGRLVRPAENCWHLVIVREHGEQRLLLVGPWTSSGIATFGPNAEVLWLKFRLGTSLHGHPLAAFRDQETPLPLATGHSFWLGDTAWSLPHFEDAELFVEKLARMGVLRFDPLVEAALQEAPSPLAPRTVRHRLVQATGLSLQHIQRVQRAQEAARLLAEGVPIMDTMFRLGYFDQPHLTRSLRRWVGQTPAQLFRP